ncbi:MAG: PstS family phosphate ABC transporter substrate-binding protein [Flavobacteriales bacterium]
MKKTLFCAAISALLMACDEQPATITAGITSGKLMVGVDHSFEPLMQTEIYTYTSLNEEAKIEARYKPESDVLNDLMNDSIQGAVICRALNADELAYFKSRNRYPESIPFAWDAVALVVNPANKDTNITLYDLKSIFTGKYNEWSQLTEASHKGNITVVFDNNKSSNARFIKEQFLGDAAFPANCFAVQTNEEVINYVGENKGAIGVIGLNWISDNVDKTAQKFLEKVSVMGITNPAAADTSKAFKPYQSYVWDKSYPLTRQVYFIQAGAGRSLGTGFANYLLTEKGQLIIDRIGMVPVTPTTRIIEISN